MAFKCFQMSVMPTEFDHSSLSNKPPFSANWSQKNNVLILDSTSWLSRCKPHVTPKKPNITYLDRDLPAGDEKELTEPGGSLIDFCRWLQRLIKLKSWLSVGGTLRTHKAWVEAGLGAEGADNELHIGYVVFTLHREEVVIRTHHEEVIIANLWLSVAETQVGCFTSKV